MTQELKIKYLKRIINSKGYMASRADFMNDRIQYWRESYDRANTGRAREFCDSMIGMYLKRYTFYITKKN